MRRLFPVPFRLIEDSRQFKKWQWIEARVDKATKDHRPESYKIFVDTINCGETVDTKNSWAERLGWLEKLPTFFCFDTIDAARFTDKVSLALLRPKRLVGLDILKARNADWTDDEREKLLREQMQGNLFSEEDERKQVRRLNKVPFDFYYRYMCDTTEGEKEYRHKIVDWEACALFWNCHRDYGSKWEAPFRAKLEEQLGSKELMFLMGNQHRFQDQWLIVSIIYPPRQQPKSVLQKSFEF